MKNLLKIAVVLVAVSSLTGCPTMNGATKYGLGGAGAGGLIGAVAGQAMGNSLIGAAVGTAVGAGAGAIYGNSEDNAAAAAQQQLVNEYIQRGYTNDEIRQIFDMMAKGSTQVQAEQAIENQRPKSYKYVPKLPANPAGNFQDTYKQESNFANQFSSQQVPQGVVRTCRKGYIYEQRSGENFSVKTSQQCS